MTIEFNCPNCNAVIAFADKHGGKRAHCTSCQQRFFIPLKSHGKAKKIKPPKEKGEPISGFYHAVFIGSWKLFTNFKNAANLIFILVVVVFKFFTANQNISLHIQGEWLADYLGGKGKIVMLSGLKGSTVSDDRDKGAKDVYDRYPGIEIVQTVYASWAYGDAKRAMESIIASYPDLDGISSQGGAMSQAAIDSYLERGMDPPPVTGEDSNGLMKQWKKLRDSGKYPNFSSIAPGMPPWMIAEALKLGLKAVEGGDIPKVYEVDAPVITEDTLDDYVREDLPDSYWCNSRLPEDKIKEIFSR